ncbi:protocadherin Fat 4 isoform X2 [Nematostella vectensis]|uniref:protocadherin Fat 4 isoform X2 n=1 Tax=Nematostella vectensis TaxID=45351 RepID=UPI002077227C|nr:protocadherin Fat 4 isoform X2 [Nematostella vectensis]
MRFIALFLGIFILLGLGSQTFAFWFRRRRRSCSPRNCDVSQWSSWGDCSSHCGGGTQIRTRRITTPASCGGGCPSYSFQDIRRCNTQCCPVDCAFGWSQWSPCVGCGKSTQSRFPIVYRQPSCGGRSCPARESRNCDTGVCCPVNCVVNGWGAWGGCNAQCEQNGVRTRSRSIRTNPTCGGTGCPSLTQTTPCRGPCCRRDCIVSSWAAWSKCSAPTGQCGANSGSKSRVRTVTRQPSCGGSACPGLTESASCTPVPITCIVSGWSSWGACAADNGRCGAGTQTRTRQITRQPYCSSPCPALSGKRSCTHSCCPVSCQVSGWGAWGACSTTCGTGTKVRTRSVTTQASCNGAACPSLHDNTPCSQYNNRDCVQSAWSSWSACSNGCGNGYTTKTRTVQQPAVCRGTPCGNAAVMKACTSYRDNQDCKVGSWGSWGACSASCAVGIRKRTRSITVNKRCQGSSCPALSETSSCGQANGGCQQSCNNGACSCLPGYTIDSNKKTCTARDCGAASPRYCAPGTATGSTCQYAIVTCPADKTTYPVTCSLRCPKYYALKGATSITCQTNGQWTNFGTTYCRRINDPPTQVLLSNTRIAENQPHGTQIGTLSSVDPNAGDTHTYTLVSGGRGWVQIRGTALLAITTFDYETLPNRFDVRITSTDSGTPQMSTTKIFTITVTDVNEAPTDVQLSSSAVDENSGTDITVGSLSTSDQDSGQRFTYTLLDSAGGRFKIVGDKIKVLPSNSLCLQTGGVECKLNYENNAYHNIRVRTTDSGSPPKSFERNFNITVNNVNDKPRGLLLSNQYVKENAPINSVIGQFSARDEDNGQRLVFSLDNDDNGRFRVDGLGRLVKAKQTDYETSKAHQITVRVTDDGNPRLWITKQFTIVVQDVNEAPVSLTLNNRAIRENSPIGTKVGTITAIDLDANFQQIAITLDDDAGGKFALGNVTCSKVTPIGTQCVSDVTVGVRLDFEVSQSELIIVRATDSSGLFHSVAFNVTVIDVNDPPINVTLDGSLSGTVNENSRDFLIGSLQTADEDLHQTYSYILLSDGGGNFEIRADKLYTSSSANLDFEVARSYQLRVRSTDSGTPPLSVEGTVTITISDVNERPTNISLSASTITENTPPGTVIGRLSVIDPDNLGPQGDRQRHVCRLTDSSNGRVAIQGNQLVVGSAGVNYERGSSLNVTVSCADPGGLELLASFTVDVSDVNESPTAISISSLQILENRPALTKVGDLKVTDPDNEVCQRQTFNLTVLSPLSPFKVRNGALLATRPLDFESHAQWTVRIRAQDSGTPSKYFTESFTVRVLDDNDPPTAITLSSSAVDENSGIDTLVGYLSTRDEDSGQRFTYTLLDSARGRFKIEGDKLKVAQSNRECLRQGGNSCLLNYEHNQTHLIRVRTTDSGTIPLTYDAVLTITIRDINDQPRDLQLSNNRVAENASIGSSFGTFSSRDEDAGQSLVYSLSDDDGGRFRVDAVGKLFKAKDMDYETQRSHVIQAVVTDNGSPAMKMEKQFTIEVLDINEAPVHLNFTSTDGQLAFPPNSPKVRENSELGTVVGTLEALDYDALQQLSFHLDDSAGEAFSLSASASLCVPVTNMRGFNTRCTHTLRVNTTLNYEQNQAHYIVARVTDNKGLFTTRRFRVTITDENDAPAGITLAGNSLTATVDENANGALVGELVTIDEDSAQSHTYVLTDDAAGRFVTRANKLYVSRSANLDYESKNTYNITIRSTDTGNPSLNVSNTFSILVRDVNEAPSKVSLSNSRVQENSPKDTVIGQLTVTDPDNSAYNSRQSHKCSVVDDMIGQFVVDQGNVLKVGRVVLDFEQATVISVPVKCVDSGYPPLSLQVVFNITVDDVNESPADIALSGNSIAENVPATYIGTLTTTDPDNEAQFRQTFTYTLMGDTAGIPFVIDGAALNSTRPLNYERKAFWVFTIRSTDSGTPPLSVTKTFNITVVDVNEAPYGITVSSSDVDENSGQDTVIGTLSCQDPDFDQSHSYTLIDDAGGRFKVENDTLMVALSNSDCIRLGGSACKLNYEGQRQHVIRVRSTDNGAPARTSEKSLVITVNDVNDRPRDLRMSGFKVEENAPIGTRIGKLTASDEDKYQTLSFSLVDDDKGRFAIDSSGYVMKVKATDYETSQLHTIIAQARDNGTKTLAVNQTFTIVVVNINEAPINISITSLNGQQAFPDNAPTVSENSPNGTVVGTLFSLDHDAVQKLSFQITNNKFTLDPTPVCHNQTNIPGVGTICSTKLRVRGGLDYEQSAREDVIVRVMDDHGLSLSQRFTVQVLDANDKPQNVSMSGGSVGHVDENMNDALVGVLSAVDQDSSQTHSFRMVDNDGWSFVIKGNKVFTSQAANLNYEKRQTYTIVVRAVDDGQPSMYVDGRFTIKVRDVNEMPTDIQLSNNSVLENSPAWTPVGGIIVIDPDNQGPRGAWQNSACLVLNHLAAPFAVSNNTLVSTGDLNHEATPTIDAILRCYDDGTPRLYLEKTITIFVKDVNEAPSGIHLAGATVAENSGPVVVGRFHTIDPDNEGPWAQNQTFSYTVIKQSGTGSPFSTEGDFLKTVRSLDYETRNSWSVTVTSTDNKGLNVTNSFVITVQDRNDAPTKISASGPLNIAEHSPSGTYIGTLITADQDVRQSHSYNIEHVTAYGFGGKSNSSSLLGLFAIESPSGKLSLSGPLLDYEQYANYTLTVRSTDNGLPPLSTLGQFFVNVIDVNENPVNITLSNDAVFENVPIGTPVGQLTVHDPDNANLPWQLFTCVVTNAESVPFTITNHLDLIVSREIDYEQQNIYAVAVNCSERISPPLSISSIFDIDVLNVNEPPYNLSISGTKIPENGSPGDLVGVLSVQDPDTPDLLFGNVTLSIQSQSPRPDMFKLVGRSLVTTDVLDFESIPLYRLTVVAADEGNPPLQTNLSFEVHVLDNNDRPQGIQLSPSTVLENATAGAVIGSLQARDQDANQTHSFSVVDRTDLFEVRGSKLVLVSSVNYEENPTINVTIRAADDGSPSLSKEEVLAVTVIDCNDAPSDVIIRPQNIVLPENSKSGTPLANVTVVDDDTLQEHYCTLIDGQRYFYIKKLSRSEAGIFVAASELDFETMKQPITVTVKCTDDGNPQYSNQRSFNVTLSDINEAPYDITLTGSPVVEENVVKGYAIGSLSCKDPDVGQSHVFQVVGKYDNVFEVNGTNLIVKDPSYLDHEALPPPATLHISIRATDNGDTPLDVTNDVTINVTDVNEAPYDIRLVPSHVTVKEDIRTGQCIAQVTSTNPEVEQTVSYSLLSYQTEFRINAVCLNSSLSSGNAAYLTVNGPLSYDKMESLNYTYDIMVEAMDNGIPPLAWNDSVFVRVERVDPCVNETVCDGNATCARVKGTSLTCTCNPGYLGNGRWCDEINECIPNPCRPGGECTDLVNNYTCAYFCDDDPCVPGTTKFCSDEERACFCKLGFDGRNCSREINECEPSPCGQYALDCKDGIARFECICQEGYTGTVCQRQISDCAETDCDYNQVCVRPDLYQNETNPTKCAEREVEIPMYINRTVYSLTDVSDKYWQYQLQRFIMSQMLVNMSDISGDFVDNSRVSATDLYVLSFRVVKMTGGVDARVRRDVWTTSRVDARDMDEDLARRGLMIEDTRDTNDIGMDSLGLNEDRVRLRAKRDVEEDQLVSYTGVWFVVKAQGIFVPPNVFYLELRSLCLRNRHYIATDTFEGKICSAVPGMIDTLQIKPLPPRRQQQEKDNRAVIHPYMYYVIGGLGGIVLLTLLVGLILHMRKARKERELKALFLHDELLESRTSYTDAMFRHHQGGEGEAHNPVYGIHEDEIDSTIVMSDNPLYARPDEPEPDVESDTGFSNPMYRSFKVKDGKDDDYREPEIGVECANGLFSGVNIAVSGATGSPSASRKGKGQLKGKKKKKAQKRNKQNHKEEEEDLDVAFVNPMFKNRAKITETEPSPITPEDESMASTGEISSEEGRVNPLFEPDRSPNGSEDDLPTIPNIPSTDEGQVNPLYESEPSPPSSEEDCGEGSNKAEENLYATPKEEPLYSVPTKTEKPKVDHPIYDSPKRSDGISISDREDNEDSVEPLPMDIVSAFSFDPSPRPRQVLEDRPGQSDC